MGHHRRLSLCSLPVPKQSEESLRSSISFAQSAICGTWQPARCVIYALFLLLLGHCGAVLLRSYEVSLGTVDRQQIRNHLAGHRQGGAVRIPLLLLLFVNRAQVVILSRRQLRSFHQGSLNMFVPLLGQRCAHLLVRGTLFVSAQATVADRLLDRPEARYL